MLIVIFWTWIKQMRSRMVRQRRKKERRRNGRCDNWGLNQKFEYPIFWYFLDVYVQKESQTNQPLGTETKQVPVVVPVPSNICDNSRKFETCFTFYAFNSACSSTKLSNTFQLLASYGITNLKRFPVSDSDWNLNPSEHIVSAQNTIDSLNDINQCPFDLTPNQLKRNQLWIGVSKIHAESPQESESQ